MFIRKVWVDVQTALGCRYTVPIALAETEPGTAVPARLVSARLRRGTNHQLMPGTWIVIEETSHEWKDLRWHDTGEPVESDWRAKAIKALDARFA